MYTWFRSLFVRQVAQEGSFFDGSAVAITGEEIPLSAFKGKVVLVVNTASRCGFTSQYAALEEVYQRYRDRGFVILGFPSNDFMGQEPGENEAIAAFCSLNFGVTFPLFEKKPVSGSECQAVFRFLTQQSPGRFRGRVLWNFEKFLVGRDGTVCGRWRSITSPKSAAIVRAIEKVV